MRIERAIKTPHLWEYVKDNLPKSLVANIRQDGYGYVYGITIKKVKHGFFDWNRPLIATVEDNKITINHPNYFSDFDQIGLDYEKKFGIEITLKVWEEI